MDVSHSRQCSGDTSDKRGRPFVRVILDVGSAGVSWGIVLEITISAKGVGAGRRGVPASVRAGGISVRRF